MHQANIWPIDCVIAASVQYVFTNAIFACMTIPVVIAEKLPKRTKKKMTHRIMQSVDLGVYLKV